MNLLDKDLVSIQEVRNMVAKANKAQQEFAKFSQEAIDQIVYAMKEAAYPQAEFLGQLASEETGFGKWQDKKIKNEIASKGVYDHIKEMKTIGIIHEDQEKRIVEIGTPVGIIAALIPSTNPTSTVIYKTLIALKSGNAIIFSPHPNALKSILKTVEILNKAAVEAGAPEGLIHCMTMPTLEGTNELMKHKDVDLILATGGSGMVKAAYSSGTPALGVGPGNVPAFIERSANIKEAIEKIVSSKTFDHGTVCASEQAIVTERCIAEKVKEEMKRQGGYFLAGDQLAKVTAIMETASGGMNPKIVGRSAQDIAKIAGIEIPKETKILLCEEKRVGKHIPFSKEKLTALLAFYTVEDWQEACELCYCLLENGGLGHTLVIHSQDEAIIREFALKKPVSRFLVNTPSTQGAIGLSTNLAPSFTLGCGAIGGSATSDNVGPMHLINIRRMAYGIEDCKETKKTEELNNIDIETITQLVMESLKNKLN
ncbi:acetaldehyde dehydrogenase (acetylating) [Clostridium formicaceticum]|uniref:Acetaldehyde dehydrogenase (Acetylating) n=1 Tax=Clostridium formicaceticum TaxID=1497 RepID=A0AAC9RKU6_9CLOT|nr:acetaldehyde dehydrogenase (acetylating) [Clostridium formicaceticum]AOY75791.1 acetaldehyde dehydrogenase (acetylating) [Clostridium formicaceticum]ARE86120.1 Aldehyde-alcohol dehydrogenase [Clostridium formicaceticum]